MYCTLRGGKSLALDIYGGKVISRTITNCGIYAIVKFYEPAENGFLQRASKNAVPFTSYYHPDGELGSTDTDFSIGQLLSNSSVEQIAWTYFLLDIPTGAAGANIHVRLSSDSILNYRVYTQFGGLPSIHTSDYSADSTSSTNGSMFLASHDSSGKNIDFYVLSAREGTWCIGIMHPPRNNNSDQTTMSIWLEGCPSHCNHHGACRNSIDETGLTFYRLSHLLIFYLLELNVV